MLTDACCFDFQACVLTDENGLERLWRQHAVGVSGLVVERDGMGGKKLHRRQEQDHQPHAHPRAEDLDAAFQVLNGEVLLLEVRRGIRASPRHLGDEQLEGGRPKGARDFRGQLKCPRIQEDPQELLYHDPVIFGHRRVILPDHKRSSSQHLGHGLRAPVAHHLAIQQQGDHLSHRQRPYIAHPNADVDELNGNPVRVRARDARKPCELDQNRNVPIKVTEEGVLLPAAHEDDLVDELFPIPPFGQRHVLQEMVHEVDQRASSDHSRQQLQSARPDRHVIIT
eukprot:scaffold2136_cov242-Pinguiococcus_pyrenoidosus.AAC.2